MFPYLLLLAEVLHSHTWFFDVVVHRHTFCVPCLVVDREGVMLDKEVSSNTTLLSYSNATTPFLENDTTTTTRAPSNTLTNAELLPSASPDVFATNSALESAVDMETPNPPIFPTPSSQYDSLTSTTSVFTNGKVEDPTSHCTFPSVTGIFIVLQDTDATVFFTLSNRNNPVCEGSVHGVRLAKWGPDVTTDNTVDQMKLQWGPWKTGFIPETFSPEKAFDMSFTNVTLNEAYYAQVATGRVEDFIDGFTEPETSVISNVIFLGTQGTLLTCLLWG